MNTQFKVNRTKAALLRGESVVLADINRVFNPVVVEMIAQAGYSCVWIDMEHTHLSLDGLSNLIIATRMADLDAIVRIPHGPYNQVIKPLELGAGGLIWPHCKSADDARHFVSMAKYQPIGMRGMGLGRDSHYGKLGLKKYVEKANEHTLLGVMIEDKEGVDNVDAIAAIEGIDLLFVGHGDLSQSYGVVGEADHPINHEKILEVYDKVGAACRTHGKVMGTPVAPNESMRNVVEKGVRWLNCIQDLDALRDGYSSALQATNKILKESNN